MHSASRRPAAARPRGREPAMTDTRLPVTGLPGFLGADKTTLLDRVLSTTGADGPARADAARSLDADAGMTETGFADVPTSAIRGTGIFGVERVHRHPLRAREVHGLFDRVPQTGECGVGFFVYRTRRPFDPARIHAVLSGPLPGVIRAKGQVRIATRPDRVEGVSRAGALSSVVPLGTWWAAVPRARRQEHAARRPHVRERRVEPLGDRRQEIVFIGVGIDWPDPRVRVGACLLPESAGAEVARGTGLADPFPHRRRSEDAE